MPKQTFLGELSSLEKINAFIRECTLKSKCNSNDSYTIELAVDEACMNIIEHGFNQNAINEKIIICNCEVFAHSIKITLIDNAPPFNPSLAKKNFEILPLHEMKKRGLGISLIYHLMDEVHYEYIPTQGNTLVLIKHCFNKEA